METTVTERLAPMVFGSCALMRGEDADYRRGTSDIDESGSEQQKCSLKQKRTSLRSQYRAR
jgi:hypothetical protein